MTVADRCRDTLWSIVIEVADLARQQDGGERRADTVGSDDDPIAPQHTINNPKTEGPP